MNCHHVTEAMISPWGFESGRLFYFDFKDNKIHKGFMETLFAKKNLFSESVEQNLNRYIEDPIIKFRNNTLYKTDNIDWKTYRALALYFVIQTKRVRSANDMNDDSDDIETFFNKGETFLDDLAHAFYETHTLFSVDISETNHILLFPETGFFIIPFFDNNNVCINDGFAVPLNLKTALVLTKKDTPNDCIQNSRKLLMGFSSGLGNYCNRVLIPPAVMNNNDRDTVISQILKQRKEAKTLIDLSRKQKNAIDEMLSFLPSGIK